MLLFSLCDLSVRAPFTVRINNMNSLAINLFLPNDVRAEITTKSFPSTYNINNARNVDLRFFYKDSPVPYVGYNPRLGKNLEIYYDISLLRAHSEISRLIPNETPETLQYT